MYSKIISNNYKDWISKKFDVSGIELVPDGILRGWGIIGLLWRGCAMEERFREVQETILKKEMDICRQCWFGHGLGYKFIRSYFVRQTGLREPSFVSILYSVFCFLGQGFFYLFYVHVPKFADKFFFARGLMWRALVSLC